MSCLGQGEDAHRPSPSPKGALPPSPHVLAHPCRTFGLCSIWMSGQQIVIHETPLIGPRPPALTAGHYKYSTVQSTALFSPTPPHRRFKSVSFSGEHRWKGPITSFSQHPFHGGSAAVPPGTTTMISYRTFATTFVFAVGTFSAAYDGPRRRGHGRSCRSLNS